MEVAFALALGIAVGGILGFTQGRIASEKDHQERLLAILRRDGSTNRRNNE